LEQQTKIARFAGAGNKAIVKVPTDWVTIIFILIGVLVFLIILAFCLKCAYDRNNNFLMMSLPESERKIYAALVGIEREHDKRFNEFENL